MKTQLMIIGIIFSIVSLLYITSCLCFYYFNGENVDVDHQTTTSFGFRTRMQKKAISAAATNKKQKEEDDEDKSSTEIENAYKRLSKFKASSELLQSMLSMTNDNDDADDGDDDDDDDNIENGNKKKKKKYNLKRLTLNFQLNYDDDNDNNNVNDERRNNNNNNNEKSNGKKKKQSKNSNFFKLSLNITNKEKQTLVKDFLFYFMAYLRSLNDDLVDEYGANVKYSGELGKLSLRNFIGDYSNDILDYENLNNRNNYLIKRKRNVIINEFLAHLTRKLQERFNYDENSLYKSDYKMRNENKLTLHFKYSNIYRIDLDCKWLEGRYEKYLPKYKYEASQFIEVKWCRDDDDDDDVDNVDDFNKVVNSPSRRQRRRPRRRRLHLLDKDILFEFAKALQTKSNDVIYQPLDKYDTTLSKLGIYLYLPQMKPLIYGGGWHPNFKKSADDADDDNDNDRIVYSGKGRRVKKTVTPLFSSLDDADAIPNANGVNCVPKQRIALLVTVKNRQENLKNLLFYMHSFLQRQKKSYKIFVIEQVDEFYYEEFRVREEEEEENLSKASSSYKRKENGNDKKQQLSLSKLKLLNRYLLNNKLMRNLSDIDLYDLYFTSSNRATPLNASSSNNSSSSSSSSRQNKLYTKKSVPFNKGRLYNIGFDYLMRYEKEWEFNCVILHDVDLMPINLNLDYACDDMPRHYSVTVKKMQDESNGPNYRFLTGGVLAIRPHHFIKTNGFSNEYWSWGGEDDDFTIRMIEKELCVKRSHPNESVYIMQNHKRSRINEKRWSLIMSATNRMDYDGLSNVNHVSKLIGVNEYDMFTHLKVNVTQGVVPL